MLRPPPCPPLFPYTTLFRSLRPDLASAYGDFGRRQDRRVLLYLSGFTNGLVIDVELDMTAWFGLGREARLYVSGQEIGRASCRERVSISGVGGGRSTETRGAGRTGGGRERGGDGGRRE